MKKAIDYKDKGPMFYWAAAEYSSLSQNLKSRYDQALDTPKYILTKKRDGSMYRALITDEDIIFQSRTVSKKTGDYVEKQENVPQIVNELKQFPKNTIFVGEICFPESKGATDSSNVVSIMGALPNKAIERQKNNPLVFYIFDLLMWDGEDYSTKAYGKRLEKLMSIKKDFDFIEFVEPVYENKREVLAQWLEEGKEGGMLMAADKPYSFGEKGKQKRPAWVSIKIKQSVLNDIDLFIVDFTSPNKNYIGNHASDHCYWELHGEKIKTKGGSPDEGAIPVTSTYFNDLIGGFVLAAYNDKGEAIEVCRVSNLTDSMKQDATANPDKYLLKVCTVGAMSIDYERRSLRHPKLMKLREDKVDTECLLKNVFGEQ